MWRPGSKIVHPFNPELGVGVVQRVEGRFLIVRFPEVDRELTLGSERSGLERLVLRPGARVLLVDSDEQAIIAESLDHSYRLSDGRIVDDANVWPLDSTDTPIERLARLQLDPLRSFANRIDGLRLETIREAGGLGPFLGGRIELFPHQLHTALRAVEGDPVRWLLADEVGLGKTIEACLILSALVRTGRATRALIVAPGTLTVQWLGELYRKFHQIFVLLDAERMESVERDFGEGVNPFDVHPFAVISLEMLSSDRRLCRLAAETPLDVIVVDEAHRLARREVERELAPLLERAKHALLLTAAPLQADREGFYRLVRLLHPQLFPSFDAFAKAVEAGDASFPCTSAVTRDDVGGLPPRVPIPIDLPAPASEVHADPRAAWLAERVRGWLDAREKALVFVKDLTQLDELRRFLETRTQTHMAVFHENLSAAGRDIEVARFRDTHAPVLLSSDAGAEGRNFQFCQRIVHYDLPSDPVILEQRIGRLDRIGRKQPVEIVYFRHATSKLDLGLVFEKLDLFGRPSAGLDAALAGVGLALADALAHGHALDLEALASSVDAIRTSAARSVPQVFYPDAYDVSRDSELLSLVPPDLEKRTRSFCLGAANDLGLQIVEKGGKALYFLELARSSTVDSLPGVPDDARYLGTFDRSEAVRRDEIDFFASGHPLVEGLLLELEDGQRGRATIFEIPDSGLRGAGLLAIFRDGGQWTSVAVDTEGTLRPEWAERVVASLASARPARPEDWGLDSAWPEAIRELGARAESARVAGRISAAAFFRLR